MSQATHRKARGSRMNGRQPIKSEPDSATDSHSLSEPGTVALDVNPYISSNASHFGGSSSCRPVNQAFYQGSRSDAPTPSERIAEPDPLFREVKMPANTIVIESPESQEGTESFFHASFQDIGKKLKACNDTLGELQQLGVSHDVQLPELVLVGDQSAGKSSLMSGLANLSLPRSEGTCTRCPLHIRVSRNNDSSCRVWLRREYENRPPKDHLILERDVTDQDPFFPWRKLRSAVTLEFKTMRDHSELEEVLRWAQIAILNDDKSHQLYVPGEGSIATNTPVSEAAEQVSAKFSPNVVALEIKGPDMPDLSFYDMPGIFQNPADARDDYLVSVVKNLSRAYIQHPSAIILCSMPMNSDAVNSATFGLIRHLKALERTIGVLTKADLLPDTGNYEQWMDIMENRAHVTGLGYFVTSRPQNQELDSLKKWEESLFDDPSDERWPDTLRFPERCGVEKLKTFLSEKLGEEFAKSLPNIKHTLKHHLSKIEAQLKKLPELPDNIELVVHTSVMEFGEQARSKLKPAEFSTSFTSLTNDFRNCLLGMKPEFTLTHPGDSNGQSIIIDDSDSDDAASTVTNTPTKRRAMAPPVTPSKRPRISGTPNPGSFNGAIKAEDERNSVPPTPTNVAQRTGAQFPDPFAQFTSVGSKFRTIQQVREDINRKSRVGLPGIITEEVYIDMCREATQPWDGPMKAFLDQVMRVLNELLNSALADSFERLNKRLIYQECQKILKEYLGERGRETLASLNDVYKLETHRLFTVNQEALSRYKKDELIFLTRYRHQLRLKALCPSGGPRLVPWESLTVENRLLDEKRRKADIVKIGPDLFEKELRVVSYVRGYYRLAALRFADAVALHVANGMIPQIQERLPFYLDQKLGLRGPSAACAYEELMAEDKATAEKRKTLKRELEKFEKALASIVSLQTGNESQENQGEQD